VPSGLSTATFSATAGALSASGSAIVTASLNGVSSTTTITLSAPATPHSVTLNWTASTSPNLIGYNIYRGTVSGGPYTKLNSSPVAVVTYTDNNVVAGQTYYYVATAVNNTAESGYSSPPVSAVIPTP
jgi:fibronectin type 3 domain-containing protein